MWEACGDGNGPCRTAFQGSTAISQESQKIHSMAGLVMLLLPTFILTIRSALVYVVLLTAQLMPQPAASFQ